MTIAVLRFPGTNNENDVLRALSLIDGAKPVLVPSRKGLAGLEDADGIVIPGGFSYGDYLRAGAVASVETITEGVRDLVKRDQPDCFLVSDPFQGHSGYICTENPLL